MEVLIPPMKLSKLEKDFFKKYSSLAGIDEAGRGPLAGPVAAAVVVLKKPLEIFPDIEGIRDSKQIPEKKREEIFNLIKNHSDISFAVSLVSPRMIEKINIRQAVLLACQKNWQKLTFKPDFVFLDGGLDLPCLNKEVVKGGDKKILAIALASIVAKVTRDNWIKRNSKKYFQYGFLENKGYGTQKHLAAIKKWGPCAYHRRNFRPVFEAMPFSEKVLFCVGQIPQGQFLTYKEVAEKIGRPQAYRAVGNVLKKNYDKKIPCHRVIKSDGKIGEYNRGIKQKEKILKKEKAI